MMHFRTIRLLVVLLSLGSLEPFSSFPAGPCNFRRTHEVPTPILVIARLAQSDSTDKDDNTQGISDNEDANVRNSVERTRSVSRTGGRVQKYERGSGKARTNAIKFLTESLLEKADKKRLKMEGKRLFKRLLLPLLSLWVLFQVVSWSVPPRSSFVYYQSSVYESRVMGVNGQLETTRKESVKTNVPNLLKEQADQKKRMDREFDREFDDEINRYIDRSMRRFEQKSDR
jgi:hypothetical protein